MSICKVILLCEIEKRQLCLYTLKNTFFPFSLNFRLSFGNCVNSNRFSVKQFLSLLSSFSIKLAYLSVLSKLEAAYLAYCGHDQYYLSSFWHVPVLFRKHTQNSTVRDFSVVNCGIRQCQI